MHFVPEDRDCPQCGGDMYYDSANAVQRCRVCGHKIAFEQVSLAEAERRRAAAPAPVVPALTTRIPVDARARSLYDTAHSFLAQGDRDEAARQFRRAAEVQSDFVDPYLWLARLNDDPQVKRDQLGAALAYDPGNLEALRMLMVLNGQMTEAEVARTYHHNDPVERSAGVAAARSANAPAPSAAKTACPVCGGTMSPEPDPDRPGYQRAVCDFCGHAQAIAAVPVGAESLGMALLRQKASGVRWKLEGWIARCGNCGAEMTQPPDRMTHECAFCGSTQMIRVNAVPQMEQPDSVVPFTVNAAAAREALFARLQNANQRFARLFSDNRVKDVRLSPAYLPFWAFDALLDTTVTVTDKNAHRQERDIRRLSNPLNQRTWREQSGAMGVLVPAFTQPSRALASQAIDNTDLSAQIGYDPRLLAKIPAGLYTLPVDKASLEARTQASEQIRREQMARAMPDEEMRVSALVISMTFSLVLLPVWTAALLEYDGDHRTALINGQTGRVALSRASAPGNVEKR